MGGQTSIQHVKDRFSAPNKNQVILSHRQQRVSRNNVFKLSGNMALGANDAYPSNDFDIKNSLKLLKSKQPSKPNPSSYQSSNAYSGSYSTNVSQRQSPAPKNYGTQGQNHSYQQAQSSRSPPGSYKDVYQQMEQHYPSNNHAPKQRSNTRQEYQPYKPKQEYQAYKPKQDYQQYRQNQRAKPIARAQKQEYRQQPEYKSRGPLRGGNAYEEKNIKQLNRQNRVQIQQYDPSEFVECSEGCGRKFNPQSIAKHQAICRKVFQQKRKAFNAQDQRLVANEQKKLMKKGEQIQRKIQQKKARQKIPKWKAESLQLRAGIKQSRNEDYTPSKEELRMMEQARNNSMLKCQFCGRSFNEQAAAKHIPFCQAQQRKNQIRRR